MVAKGDSTWVATAFCDHPDCSSSMKTHAWGFIKANDAGWFIQKNGDCWCPEHIPEWVALWRAKKRGDYLGS